MPTVTIARNKVCVDDTAIPLLSGEVHYWRLDPASWRPVLQRVREMGLQTVATYVCWDFHEIEPGQYDFEGKTDPRRNLTGFLDLLSAEGFWIILRPGPYIYSEWRNGGVPDDAARLHRLDPAFQERARPYMQAVVQATRPYLASNGGRVILWQADNEIDPWPHWYTEQLGLGHQPGPFQEFLCQRYGDLAALNEAWDTAYESFEQVRAVSAMFPNEPAWMRRYLDFARFQHWYVKQVAAWATNVYREMGVDVPIYLNAYSGVATQPWAELEALADLAGPDIYPSRELALRPNELRSLLEAVRYTRTYSCLPYIPEFEAGIWHDWLPEVGILPANHYRLLCLAALLAGAAGWNWYMLVNRDNWYQSPINEWGNTRPDLFQVFQQIVSIYQDLDPASLTPVTHTAVTFDPLQRGTQRPGQNLLQAFYQADIDYEFFDVSRGECHQPLLFYAGEAWLSRAAQEKLNDYILRGGHLVCLGAYPYLDDQLRPLNLLGVAAQHGIVSGAPGALRLHVLDSAAIKSHWLYNYTEIPGDAIVAERLTVDHLSMDENRLQFDLQAGTQYTVGYTEVRGRGRLTVMGLSPSSELLAAIHHAWSVPIPCRSNTAGVITALLRRAQEYYLIAVNHGNEDKIAEVVFDPGIELGGLCQIHDLTTGWQGSIDMTITRTIAVPLPRKDGAVLRIKGGAA